MKLSVSSLIAYVAKVLILACAYIITGKVGLLLSVSPGYATAIWPPSGIAIAVLLLYGRTLWLGVFIGSLVLDFFVDRAATPEYTFALSKFLVALAIATGSTTQALVITSLIKTWIGFPFKLTQVRKVAYLFLLSGPFGCVISASVAMLALYTAGIVPLDKLVSNWLVWWSGDVFGVLIFLPLLIAALRRNLFAILRNNGAHSPAILLLFITVCLGLTFYAWTIATKSADAQNRLEFESLTQESEKALINRFDSYENALLGGAGFFRGSNVVSRDEWRHYVETIQIKKNFPSLHGLGWVQAVDSDNINQYKNMMLSEHGSGFTIHPNVGNSLLYVVTYIEPEATNQIAIGLNIAFEANRLEAAQIARDLGKPALSKHVALVQYEKKTPGFMVLQPVYKIDSPTNTVDERRAALRGWIYALLIAKSFLNDLTQSQAQKFNLKVYDGTQATADTLIYRSGGSDNDLIRSSAYSVQKQVTIMQRPWLLVWESTPAFERAINSVYPLFILVGGLLFTGVFAVTLLIAIFRRLDSIETIEGERRHTWPLIVFVLMACGSYGLLKILEQKELAYVGRLVQDEATKMELLLTIQTNDKLMALKRMAQRWNVMGGTPFPLWQSDASLYRQHLSGLKTMEWVDASYHVRWVEPVEGNQNAIGLNVLLDKVRAKSLEGAAEKFQPIVTPPLDLVQGYKAFVAYLPLSVRGHFDGFIVGIFSFDGFFGEAISREMADSFAVAMSFEDKVYFTTVTDTSKIDDKWATERTIQIYDKPWKLRLIPTKQFLASQKTALPMMVFIAGLLVSLLSALSLRYILLARLRLDRLQASNKRIQVEATRTATILNTVSDGVLTVDDQGLIASINPAGVRMFGYQPRELIGRRVQFIFPDSLGLAFAVFSKSLALASEMTGIDREVIAQHKDGSSFPVELTINHMVLSDQRIFVFTVHDVTELRLQQHILTSTAAQMHLLAKNTPAAVAMFDKNLHHIMMSDRWKQDYGFEDRDLIGVSLYETFPEILDQPKWLDIHQRVLGGEVFDLQEESWIRADGSIAWVKWAMHPWRDVDGEVGGIIIFTVDITARVQSATALKTSEETFRSAMESASIGMALVAPDGRWLRVNKSLVNLLGYSEQELLASDFQTITFAEDLEDCLEHKRRLLDGEIDTYYLEKRYYHRSGRVLWALLSVSLVRHADGSPNYLIAQIQDISERKEMERLKSEFVSMVSHELRTPLTSIRGSLGLIMLAMFKDLPEKAQKMVDIAYKNCERLILLINDILDIDKMDSGQMRFDMSDVSIATLTQQAVEANEAYAQKFGVNFVCRLIDESIFVSVDPARYIQVMSNLLSNAAKFSPTGEQVLVFAERRGSHVRVSIQDKGPGIPEEFQSRLFGRFLQVDSSMTRARGGSGLGLHISKQIVEQMNGSIGFETEPGRGSTFWVEFSVVATRVGSIISDSFNPIQEKSISTSQALTGKSKFLHIEFDLDFSQFLAEALNDSVELLTANTLRRAELILRRQEFDAIVLDLDMPDGSGLGFLERLPSLVTKPVPIVVVTSDEPPQDLHMRVAQVIVKSRVSEAKIVELILSVLNQQGPKGAAQSAA